MKLKEYKARLMQNREFAKAYEEIQPEMRAIRDNLARQMAVSQLYAEEDPHCVVWRNASEGNGSLENT